MSPKKKSFCSVRFVGGANCGDNDSECTVNKADQIWQRKLAEKKAVTFGYDNLNKYCFLDMKY